MDILVCLMDVSLCIYWCLRLLQGLYLFVGCLFGFGVGFDCCVLCVNVWVLVLICYWCVCLDLVLVAVVAC